MMHRTALQTVAASLAAALTFVMLVGVNLLATQPHAEVAMAQAGASASTQVVVVVGRRAARS